MANGVDYDVAVNFERDRRANLGCESYGVEIA